MIEQLNELFAVMVSGADVDSESALNITEHADTAEGFVSAVWDEKTVMVCIAELC